MEVKEYVGCQLLLDLQFGSSTQRIDGRIYKQQSHIVIIFSGYLYQRLSIHASVRCMHAVVRKVHGNCFWEFEKSSLI